MKQPDACIVRITNAEGKNQGTGFLVSTDGLIATCAHVVKEIREPHAVFPDGKPQPAQVVATDPAHDVAILRVEGELPDDAEPARLGRSTGAYHREFWSRGYRPLEGLEGIPAKGEVLDAVSECPGYPDVRRMPLVLDSPHIREGMSGAPVYIPDWDLVVGMITDYWDSLKVKTYPADRDTALATPAEAIVALCPDIRLCEPPPELSRPPLGVPFQAPAVPRYFVPRPGVSGDLKTRLLADEAAAPGVLVVSAIHGLGGIGKSTLAAALAHDSATQTRFSDGVLWVTLGQQPDLLPHLQRWIQALGDYNFRPTTLDGASAHLRTLLQDRASLLVVDDVWDPAHATPFLVGGPQCRVLITTREALIARAVGADLYDLDVMTPDQSLALLTGRLGRDLEGAEQEQASALTEAAGYLPLALELAAAQVADGVPWAELLADLRAEIARLEVLEIPGVEEVADEASRKRLSLLASFHLSLRRLPEERRQNFAWLGVMPEDVTLTPEMAATLWETDVRTARDTLRYLRDKALLLAGPSLLDGTFSYRLHDLLHDLARRLLTAPLRPTRAGDLTGLGLTLPEAHAVLLERYRACTQDNCWPTLPDDGYIHANLTWHLEQARQGEEIHALLWEETGEGDNAWYKACQRLGQTASFLGDVARAWRLSESEDTKVPCHRDVVLQIRYALITTSLNSLAKNLPTPFLTALVEKGVWIPVQALAYARQVPDVTERAVALAGLAVHLPEPLKKEIQYEALAMVRAIEDPNVRAKWLLDVAPYLPEPVCTRVLRETVEAVRAIERKDWRNEGLKKLTSDLIELNHLEEALMAAQAIEWDWTRAEALAGLLPHLPASDQTQVKQAVLEIAWKILQRGDQAIWPLTVIPARLPPVLAQLGHPKEALTALQMVQDEKNRAEELEETVLHLPEPLLREALKMAQSIRNKTSQAKVLVRLACCLADCGYPEEALEATQIIHGEREKAMGLAILAFHLPATSRKEVLQQALQVAREIENPGDRAAALTAIIPNVSVEAERFAVLQEAVTALYETMQPGSKALVLVRLMLQLAELGGLQNALILAGELPVLAPFGISQRQALGQLALRLAELDRLEEALRVTRMGGTDFQVSILANLAPYMLRPMLQEVLRTTWKTGDGRARDVALAKLAPILAELGRPREAKLAVREAEWHYAKALVRLALHLSGPLLREALAKAYAVEFEEIRFIDMDTPSPAPMLVFEDERAQAASLAALASHLPEPFLQEALAMAHEFGNKVARMTAEVALVPRFAELGRPGKALRAARAIESELTRSVVLKRLALLPLPPFTDLRDKLLEEALESARTIKQDWRRAMTLGGLVSHLPEQLKEWTLLEALSAARKIEDEKLRARALIGLSELSTLAGQRDELLREALMIAQDIGREWTRSEVLAGLVSRLPKSLLQETIVVAQSIKDGRARAVVLEELIPRQAELGHYREALDAARELPIATTLRTFRALTLARLARLPSLTDQYDELLGEALEAARVVPFELGRAEVLSRLIPHLPEALLEEALTVIQTIDESVQAEALAALALRLIGLGRHQKALEIARTIEDKRTRMTILTAIVSNVAEPLKEQVLQEALTIARSIRRASDRVEAIVELTPHLPGSLREEILRETVVAVWWYGSYAKAFAKLAPCLPESLLEIVLDIARTVEDDKTKVAILENLVPHMPEPLKTQALRETLTALRTYGRISDRAEALAELAPHLSKPLLREALTSAQAIEDEGDRANVLRKLVPHLAKHGFLEEALLAYRAIQDEDGRVEALIELTLLPAFADRRDELLEEALTAAQAIQYEQVKAEALAKLAEHLPMPERTQILRRALEMALEIQAKDRRAIALIRLALLPAFADLRNALLKEALVATQMIQCVSTRAWVYAWWMLPYLPEPLKEQGVREALVTAQQQDEGRLRAEALAKVIPHLAELGHFEEALTRALGIESEEYRAGALAGLAPHLPDDLLPKALAAARAIEFQDYRMEALDGLAPCLAKLSRQHLYPLWQETLHLLAARTRSNLLLDLGALSPVIAALGGAQAMAETFRAIQDVGRWWP